MLTAITIYTIIAIKLYTATIKIINFVRTIKIKKILQQPWIIAVFTLIIKSVIISLKITFTISIYKNSHKRKFYFNNNILNNYKLNPVLNFLMLSLLQNLVSNKLKIEMNTLLN